MLLITEKLVIQHEQETQHISTQSDPLFFKVGSSKKLAGELFEYFFPLHYNQSLWPGELFKLIIPHDLIYDTVGEDSPTSLHVPNLLTITIEPHGPHK